MKVYTELHPWSGVIARLRVPTTDGRVIGSPAVPGTLWRGRFPLPLLCLQDDPSSCLAPTRVGHVQDMEVLGEELHAYMCEHLKTHGPLDFQRTQAVIVEEARAQADKIARLADLVFLSTATQEPEKESG